MSLCDDKNEGDGWRKEFARNLAFLSLSLSLSAHDEEIRRQVDTDAG